MHDLPNRLAHHVPGAVRPDPPDLGGDEASVFGGLVGDVVPELLLAQFRERLIGFHPRITGGGESGEDLLQSQALRGLGREEVRVFGHDLAADLLGVSVGRQIGTGEEHLAAAGRYGQETIERDRVADRPGRDDHERCEQEDRDADERRAPLASPSQEDDERDQHRHPQVLGPG